MFSPDAGQQALHISRVRARLAFKGQCGANGREYFRETVQREFDNFAIVNDVTMIDDELADAQKPPEKKH